MRDVGDPISFVAIRWRKPRLLFLVVAVERATEFGCLRLERLFLFSSLIGQTGLAWTGPRTRNSGCKNPADEVFARGRDADLLLLVAPERVAAAVFCQTVGHWPEDPDVMYRSGQEIWAPELLPGRPDLTQEDIDRYLHNLYRLNPDFLYSVSRDVIANCETPILVLPDDIPAHPHQSSVDVASLAPNAEITVFPWNSPTELKQRTINRVRKFIQSRITTC